MALERVPADIRKDGGIARMSDPKVIHHLLLLLKHAPEKRLAQEESTREGTNWIGMGIFTKSDAMVIGDLL